MRKCHGAAVLFDYKYWRCNPQPREMLKMDSSPGISTFIDCPCKTSGTACFEEFPDLHICKFVH